MSRLSLKLRCPTQTCQKTYCLLLSELPDEELWIVEEEPLYTVLPNVINTSVVVWLENQSQPNHFDYRVHEILYQNFVTHQWRIRSIIQRHFHPSEHVIFPNPPPIQNMR